MSGEPERRPAPWMIAQTDLARAILTVMDRLRAAAGLDDQREDFTAHFSADRMGLPVSGSDVDPTELSFYIAVMCDSDMLAYGERGGDDPVTTLRGIACKWFLIGSEHHKRVNRTDRRTAELAQLERVHATEALELEGLTVEQMRAAVDFARELGWKG
jgi:hypothetical protein